jgi:hypothetical protein
MNTPNRVGRRIPEQTHQQRSSTGRHSHEVLQDTELGLLDLCSQSGDFGFYPRIDLFNL